MKKVCILAGILMAFLVTGIAVNVKKDKMQKELAEQVFRFHVLANSDSKADQELKLKVKDRILSYMKEELPESDSVDTTKKWAKSHTKELEEVATEVVREEGYDYRVKASVLFCNFPDKSYGDVTFPAGRYEALRIEIGEGGGQNWWCVLYPNLCFFDAVHAVVPDEGKEDLKKVLEEDTYEMVTSTSRFRIKWFFFR